MDNEISKKPIYRVDLDTLSLYKNQIDYIDEDTAFFDVKGLQQIDTMKWDMNVIILCCKGRMQLEINGRKRELGKSQVLFCPSRVVTDNYVLSSDLECKIMCLSERLIHFLLGDKMSIWNHAVYIRNMNAIKLPESHVEQLTYYYALIRFKISHPDCNKREDIFQTIVKALLLELCAELEQFDFDSDGSEMSQGKIILNAFLEHLSETKYKKLSVQHYAYDLNITPKYLTLVCKEYTGRSASQWILQYTLDDIRYYLKYTDKSIKEISNLLGFSNLSHFGSYVRKYMGCSPRKLRVKLLVGQE